MKRVTQLYLNSLGQIKLKPRHLTVPHVRLLHSKKKNIFFGASSAGALFAKNAYLNPDHFQVVVLIKMAKGYEEKFVNFVIASFWLETCYFKLSHLLLLKIINRKKLTTKLKRSARHTVCCFLNVSD